MYSAIVHRDNPITGLGFAPTHLAEQCGELSYILRVQFVAQFLFEIKSAFLLIELGVDVLVNSCAIDWLSTIKISGTNNVT